MSARWSAHLTASVFNRLDQYANSPDNRTYSYTELAVSSLLEANTITSTHCAHPRRDGQAELAWMTGMPTHSILAYRGGMSAQRRSPIPILTGLNVE